MIWIQNNIEFQKIDSKARPLRFFIILKIDVYRCRWTFSIRPKKLINELKLRFSNIKN